MQRSSIIATVVAAGGVLIAGSVASVAVINAASSSQPQSQTVALVSDQQTQSPEDVATDGGVDLAAAAGVAAASASAPAQVPSLAPEPLPEVPEVDDQQAAPVTVYVAPQTYQAPAAPARPQANSGRQDKPKKPKPTASASARPSEQAREEAISADRARDLVLEATGGGVAKSVEKEDHQGYAAWAVKVLRHDGSTVTGYVDRYEGVIFDWVVNEPAPAPTQPAANSGSGGGGEHEDDDHEDDHHEDGDDD